jgi:hypothetical protein
MTRSCPQTRSHAQKFFRKLQKHGYLTGVSISTQSKDNGTEEDNTQEENKGTGDGPGGKNALSLEDNLNSS